MPTELWPNEVSGPRARAQTRWTMDGGRSATLKCDTEDCRRVFTTSKGHVTIAPTVPPSLETQRNMG